MNPFLLIESVVFLCSKHGGSVCSWGRTPKHNQDVGGVENSLHMLYLGCDVVLDDMFKNTVFEKDAGSLGLNAIFEGDHYHLQPKNI